MSPLGHVISSVHVTIANYFYLQICQILHNVCKKEGLSLPAELSKRIAEKSNRNLRRALLMCEACRVQQYVLHKQYNLDI